MAKVAGQVTEVPVTGLLKGAWRSESKTFLDDRLGHTGPGPETATSTSTRASQPKITQFPFWICGSRFFLKSAMRAFKKITPREWRVFFEWGAFNTAYLG